MTLDKVIQEEVRRDHARVFWGDRLLTIDKAAGFLDDPHFARAFTTIKGNHLYDQYTSPDTIAWRLHTLIWAARSGLTIDGDFVECGVFKGDMSYCVVSILGDSFKDRRFYLYDSFEGFSPKLSSHADYPAGSGFLDFANKVYREEGIESSVRDRFAPYPNVKVIKGFVPDSFAIDCPDRIAYLHIDLNSPLAEVAALEHLFDRVSPGGMVVFDDYGWQMFSAQRHAEDAFFAQRDYQVLELPTGQGLVVKR